MLDPVSAATSLRHAYRYAGESSVAPGALYLATSVHDTASVPFFSGVLADAKLTAELLRALSRIVGARFFVPPGMLARILREADPVVTFGGDTLRFEGFSSCCSAHARVDLLPAAYAAERGRHGTTNVDFNAPMRAALASVRRGERVQLDVGADEVSLGREERRVVEKKVALPLRWVRGFVEVQAYQARMRRRFTLAGPQALRLLRSVPRASTSRHVLYALPSAGGARLAMTDGPGAVAISAAERLRVLEDLAPFARALTVYEDDDRQASAWEMDLGAMRFVLTLSASNARGFSGEGQALASLARSVDPALVARARAALHWDAEVTADALAERIGAGADEIQAVLARLGGAGLVGFDLATGAYFHRVLPFDLEQVETMQPRLAAARALVAKGGVERRGDETFVQGSDVVHRVREIDGVAHCTCPWFAKHGTARGPCKHLLAAELAEA